MNRREFLKLLIGKQAQAKEDTMSFTTNYAPSQGYSLVVTPKGNLMLNATRINPGADKSPDARATLPMDQLFEYAYVKPNGAVVIKQVGQMEFTFYPAERKAQADIVQPEISLDSASNA